ncbi:metal-dependent phosphohydrolase [Comamonas odontotermitis]|uniref:metal-dependent phosphohydrolase n=1 Tax=Comamonas odontotermitis TaxID=379895 RepID=UPI00366F0381
MSNEFKHTVEADIRGVEHTQDEFAVRESVIGPNILLASGVYFHFDDPLRTGVSVEDIAHALSHLCRFTGHCREFYSVAQHAVLVSQLVPPELAYQALHHDDVEAVMGDMSSPLKKLIPEYKRLEHEIERAILAQRGIRLPMPDEVKRADLIALRTEQRDLMPELGGKWMSLHGIKPADIALVPMSPAAARAAYLLRHEELWPEYAARHQPQATPLQPRTRSA